MRLASQADFTMTKHLSPHFRFCAIAALSHNHKQAKPLALQSLALSTSPFTLSPHSSCEGIT